MNRQIDKEVSAKGIRTDGKPGLLGKNPHPEIDMAFDTVVESESILIQE
ncbi:MAG: hypothetical protein MSS69_09470 [Spirochaetales bacterium]|nr:hypothetical protein [Spirochaetales bacterium]